MFYYRKISRDLIKDLTERLLQGQSIALFASYFGGKRYVLRHIFEGVRTAGRAPLVKLRLLEEPSVKTMAKLHQRMRTSLERDGVPIAPTQDPFDAIADYAQTSGKQVTLFAANLDSIPHDLTRHLLRQFRKLVEKNALTVAMTGESDFHELVAGENSEFTSSENYFLQGFDLDEFGVLLNQYLNTLGVKLGDHDAIVDLMWRRSGGSGYLLRPLLVQVVERLVRQGVSLQSHQLTLQDFDDWPNANKLPGNYWTQLCRHATKLIAQAPECWEELEKLKLRGSVEASSISPTILEWAGVVTRNEEGDQLTLASEMMRNYVERHYDALALGDLCAQHGQWQKAFAHYQSLPQELKRRPHSTLDRLQLARIIPVFGAALYAEATNGVSAVKRLFIQGCQHLLGFSEVTFWCGGNGSKWKLIGNDGTSTSPPPELKAHLAEILPDKINPKQTLVAVPDLWKHRVVVQRLDSSLSNYSNYVVVSDLETGNAIIRERRHLLEKLLHSLALAFNHAIAIRIREARIERGRQQLELINSVLAGLGSRVLDVNGVLQRAAAGLAHLGKYKRVLFCLIDPRGERIQGVLDYRTDWASTDVAKLTNYDLKDTESDIQPWVIFYKRPFVTSDASLAKYTNKAIVELAGMKAEAIVPIFNEADDAIGTIHIERADGFEPPSDEIDDLISFGRLLATVIEQAERVNLMQATLDGIPTPVAIVNAQEKFRYANRAASQTLNIPHHWQENNRYGIGLKDIQPQLSEMGGKAIKQGKVTEKLSDGSYAISQPIQDWQKKTVGAFFYLPESFNGELIAKALLRVALQRNTDKAMEAALEAAKDLEFQQGRLYVFNESTQELVSRKCYGMVDEPTIEQFNKGELRLPLSHSASWYCKEKKAPVVFCYDPHGIDGAESRTPQGLDFTVVTRPYFEAVIRKRLSEFWVDVPLMANERLLGKLSLACDEYLTPQRLDLLRVMTGSENELFADLFHIERERIVRDFKVREEAAEKMMFSVAHNLATRFGSFPGYLNLYRSYERDLPALRALNEDFGHTLHQVQTVVKRAKERLSPVLNLNIEELELGSYLKQTCRNLMPEGKYQVTLPNQDLPANFDPHLVELALSELIDNSIAAQREPESLRVEIVAQSLTASDVQILYRDNGSGISEEIRERVFDDFFSHRPETSRGSSGMGMGFVKRVIKAHGGNIEIKRPVSGAEFLITLPVQAQGITPEGGLNGTHSGR